MKRFAKNGGASHRRFPAVIENRSGQTEPCQSKAQCANTTAYEGLKTASVEKKEEKSTEDTDYFPPI